MLILAWMQWATRLMLLIVDANVLLAAVLGQSLGLLEDIASRNVVLLVPLRMMVETQKIIGDKRRIPRLDASARLTLLAKLVTILEPDDYEHKESRARERLSDAGQKDWPVLAAALAIDAPIWSNDKHLWGTGVAVWLTRNIKFLEVEAG